MISRFAIDEIEDMEAAGLRPTPRDIVRLNALGLKVERGESDAPIYRDRRCAWVGNVCLMEPTIGVTLFIGRCAEALGVPMAECPLLVFAWCMSFRSAPKDTPPRKRLIESIGKFVAAHFKDVTTRRLQAAVDYCRFGCDSETFERPARRADADENAKLRTADDEAEDEARNIDIGVVHEAEAIGLGLSLADAMRHTRAQLNAIMSQAIEARARMSFPGGGKGNATKDRFTGEFYATLDEIRERLETESRAKPPAVSGEASK